MRTLRHHRSAATTSGLRLVWRDPLLRRMTIANLVSSLGSAMVGLAIVYVTYTRSGSVMRTVLVAGAYALPAALLGSPAGRLAQRHSRRRIILVVLGLKLVVYGTLAALEATGDLPTPAFLVFSLLSGSLSAVVYPAWQGYERDLVPEEQLDDVNATMSAVGSAAQLVGALAGGVLLGVIGADWVFVLNSFSFIPLIVVVWRTHPRESIDTAPEDHHRRPLREAVRAVRADPVLTKGFVSVLCVSLLVAPVAQLLPAIGAEISKGAHVLGMLTAAFALGGMAVVQVTDHLRRRWSRHAVATAGLVAGGAALVLLGVANAAADGAALYPPVLLALVVLGLAVSLTTTALTSLVQTHAPLELQGSLYALYGIVVTSIGAGGALVLAQLADVIDVYTVESICGVAVIAYAALGARRSRRVATDGDGPPPDAAAAAPHHLDLRLPGFVAAHRHPRTAPLGDAGPAHG